MELHSGTFNPDDFAWRGLTLTPAAAAHIRELVAKQPDMLGVRLGVKQTGCAGFGYVLDTVREAQKTISCLKRMAPDCMCLYRRCRSSTAQKSISFAKD